MRRMLWTLCLLLCLTACGASGPEAGKGGKDGTEVTVFAAASLREALTEIGEDYRALCPDVTLVFSFDSSGTLETQIREGAVCDLFLSAGQRQMDRLEDDSGLPDFLEPDTRVDLLENRVVLAVPEGNPKGVGSFRDLAEGLRAGELLLAVGNEDVPVGQYTQAILQNLGFRMEDLAESGLLTYGANAKEVTAQVSEAAADCGILYATDAFTAGLAVVDTAGESLCGRVVYPAAVIRNGISGEAAAAFLDYLRTPEAGAVFEGVGFTHLG